MKKKRVASDYGEQLMQRLLFEWLTQEAQQKVRRFVKYYHTEARLEMYYAMLRYVMFGKRTRFVKEVANWHFRLFCEQVDSDQYTPRMHEHWIFLWRKIGVFTAPTSDNEDYFNIEH